jgi:hypothetical protein
MTSFHVPTAEEVPRIHEIFVCRFFLRVIKGVTENEVKESGGSD